jgi:hypothetical protein
MVVLNLLPLVVMKLAIIVFAVLAVKGIIGMK